MGNKALPIKSNLLAGSVKGGSSRDPNNTQSERSQSNPVISEFSLSYNPSKPMGEINNLVKNIINETKENSASFNSNSDEENFSSSSQTLNRSDSGSSTDSYYDEGIQDYFQKDFTKTMTRKRTKLSKFSREQNTENSLGLNNSEFGNSSSHIPINFEPNKDKKILYKISSKHNDSLSHFAPYKTFAKDKIEKKIIIPNSNARISFNSLPTIDKTNLAKTITPIHDMVKDTEDETPKYFTRQNALRENGFLNAIQQTHFPKRYVNIVEFNEETTYKNLTFKNKSLNDRGLLFKLLSGISFLRNMQKDFAFEVIEDMQYVIINQDQLIIKQSSIGSHIFFLKKGTVKLCPPVCAGEKVYATITAPCVLGERMIMGDSIRQWDVYTTTPTYAYILKNKKTIQNLRNSVLIDKETNRLCIDKCKVLNLLTDEQKDKMSFYLRKEVFDSGNIINDYDKPNCIFILLSGSVILSNKNEKKLIEPGGIFGYHDLIFDQKHLPISVQCNKQCGCLSLLYEDLIKIFNDEEEYHIRFRNLFIRYRLSEDKYFKTIIPMLGDSVLNNFTIKFFSDGETILHKGKDISEFLYVVLEGDIYEENEPRVKLCEKTETFVLYSDKIFNGLRAVIPESIKAKGDTFIARMNTKSMLFHLGKKFTDAKLSIIRKNSLMTSKTFCMKWLNSDYLDNLANSIEEVKVNDEEYIYREDDIADSFFIVVEGEVRVKGNYFYDDVIIIKRPGDIFGINSVVAMLNKTKIEKDFHSNIKRNEFAKAIKTPTVVYKVKRCDYFDTFSENTKLIYYITLRMFYLENVFIIKQMVFHLITKCQSEGVCFLAKKNPFDEQVVFCKIYPKNIFSNDEKINEIPPKVKKLRQIDSPFIPNLLSFFHDSQYFYFLYSYSYGVPLADYFEFYKEQRNNILHLNYELCKFISIQLFLAIKELHSKNLIHKMINPKNILINTNGYLTLTHLRHTEIIPQIKRHPTTKGDYKFFSPELFYGTSEYGYGVDFWAVGVIMYYMVCQKYPFNIQEDTDNNMVIANIINEELSFNHNVINEEFKDLIYKLLCKGVEHRYKTWDEVKNHPFYRNYNISAVENLNFFIPSEIKFQKPRVNIYKNEKFYSFKDIKAKLPQF